MNHMLCVISLVMVLFPWSSLAAQQNPNGMLPVHTAGQPFLLLVRDPVVHEELRLTEEQARAVGELNAELDADMWSMRNKPPQVQAAALLQLIRATKEGLATILSPDQIRRIDQIELWVLGVKSLLRDAVAERIGLESQQLETIRSAIQASEQETLTLQQQLQEGGDREEIDRKYRQLQRDTHRQVVAALTEPQKRKWQALSGTRIDVARLGRVTFKAPEFQPASGWVNSEPLTMEKLKGKVVALHFYAFA